MYMLSRVRYVRRGAYSRVAACEKLRWPFGAAVATLQAPKKALRSNFTCVSHATSLFSLLWSLQKALFRWLSSTCESWRPCRAGSASLLLEVMQTSANGTNVTRNRSSTVRSTLRCLGSTGHPPPPRLARPLISTLSLPASTHYVP